MKIDKIPKSKIFFKQVLRYTIGGFCILFGTKQLHDAGCQKGVSTSEWFVKKYEPEAYERMSKQMEEYRKTK